MAVDQWSVPLAGWIPTPFASESITVSNAAVSLTAATYDSASSNKKAIQAFLTLADQDIRYWLDGSTPTASIGHVMTAGGSLVLSRSDMLNFKAIRKGASDGTLSVTYFCAAEP